jgi:hypothetical protein
MANAIEVSDSLSNANEQIESVAKAIGRSKVRRQVFEAIYHHKSPVKTVETIHQRTGLSRMRVLQAGRHLALKGAVKQVKKDGDTAYQKIDFVHSHKQEILRYAASPSKLAKLPTKRRGVAVLPRYVKVPSNGAQVVRITVDDIESFAHVKKVKSKQSLPDSVSEEAVKHGVQAILGEPGHFKDWGGEDSDLYSGRLRINGKRHVAAFAFKGPGERGALVPGRMGKNGDQLTRMFRHDADVFLAQHWREVRPSVPELMRSLAVAKSVSTGKLIRYGVIDGVDTERLRRAYPTKFAPKRSKSNKGKSRAASTR